MGDLVAGMLFFGIGTWPCYFGRSRKNNLFRSAGVAGSLWMIRDRPRQHVRLRTGHLCRAATPNDIHIWTGRLPISTIAHHTGTGSWLVPRVCRTSARGPGSSCRRGHLGRPMAQSLQWNPRFRRLDPVRLAPAQKTRIWHRDRRLIVTASSLGDKGRICRATRQPVSVAGRLARRVARPGVRVSTSRARGNKKVGKSCQPIIGLS